MLHALAITHVSFENLGTLENSLISAGYNVTTVDACTTDFNAVDPLAADLVVVLGGPIGVYDSESYPFLRPEIDLLRARLAAGRPSLGICLGAQLIAAAAGSAVYPGLRGLELGWTQIQPGADSARHPWFAPLLRPDLRVLHWHGDSFDLPAGAEHLAATPLYANQAFLLGGHTLGLQFHPEVTAASLERWYVGHTSDLARAEINVPALRRQSRELAPMLEQAAGQFWRGWLNELAKFRFRQVAH